jgi:hypothetical protein
MPCIARDTLVVLVRGGFDERFPGWFVAMNTVIY